MSLLSSLTAGCVWVEEELTSPMGVGAILVPHADILVWFLGICLERESHLVLWSLCVVPNLASKCETPFSAAILSTTQIYFEPSVPSAPALPWGPQPLICVQCIKLDSAKSLSVGPLAPSPGHTFLNRATPAMQPCWMCTGMTKGCQKHLYFPRISYPVSLPRQS